MPLESHAIHRRARREGLELIEWRNVYCMIWQAGPTVEALEFLFADLRDAASKHPDGMAVINVVMDVRGVPGSAERAEMKRHRDEFPTRLLGAATLLAVDGVGASVVLGFVLGVRNAVASDLERAFRTPEDAAQWAASRWGHPERELRALFEELLRLGRLGSV